MKLQTGRWGRSLFLNGNYYLAIDESGRFIIPSELYQSPEDMRLRYDLTVNFDTIIITFRRDDSPAKDKQRIFVNQTLREKYQIDTSSIYKCIPTNNGFVLKHVFLKEVNP